MDLSTIDANFRFTHGINSQLEKDSHEYRVLATIRLLFPQNNYNSVVKSEAPDFIDRDNSIGLEVTDVCFQKHRQASKEFYKLNHPVNDKKSQPENTRKTIDSGNDEDSGKTIKTCGLNFPSFSAESILVPMRRQIVIKEGKKYEQTNELDLALLFDDRINIELEDDLMEQLRISQKGKKKFKKVFVVSDYLCLEYNVSDNSFQRRLLTQEENIRIKILGRLTAEGKVNLSSPEWYYKV